MMMVEILLAALAVIGLLYLGWLLLGRLLTPVGPGPVYAVVPAAGTGEGLEQTVKGLLWHLSGESGSFAVIIADGGLDEEGLRLAHALCRTLQGVELWTAEQARPLLSWLERGEEP